MFGFLKLPVKNGILSLIIWINGLRSAKGNEEDFGTHDKRKFIKINKPPPGFKNTGKYFEVRLISMHGPNYVAHISNINCSKAFKMFVVFMYIKHFYWC